MVDSSSTTGLDDLPPYFVLKYIECYGVLLDGYLFAISHLTDNAKKIRDVHTGRKHNNAVGACIKPWWQCEGSGLIDFHCQYLETEITFPSFRFSRILGRTYAMETYWVIYMGPVS